MTGWRPGIVIALIFAVPAVASGQLSELRLPISLDADSTDYDGKSSMLIFRGLRLSQGSIGIVADVGRASKLDFQDSVWRFEGNVVIDVENGRIECDAADLRFSEHTLRLASIEGTPATFELTRPGSDTASYAEAGRLEYDLAEGVIEFSDGAQFTENGNQISSSVIVYNIRDQRVNARSSGDGDGKVKITYTPQDGAAETITDDTTADPTDAVPDEPSADQPQPGDEPPPNSQSSEDGAQ